ncbi:hypothetical protein GC722_03055 [Auraticoccus sp. F435]|uniref:TadE-like domain-containing protein n=1 Tax=Auraticoccus cholistanensis TaxID=2656650 RepID=A0A6A9UQR8_9ACTN|nr:TadE/TadG family type IV pilus assembly protein [Auraticoccus cholistanensis]MVA75011.1 hypothetical protein [Auraticoccus cholistanensis]
MTESVQWALVVPVVLATLLGAVQVATWVHGRNTVRHAAAAAAEAAAVSTGGAAGAEASRVAEQVAAAGGLDAVQVVVRSHPDRVEVAVTGDVALVVDLGLGSVSAQAAAPRERVS